MNIVGSYQTHRLWQPTFYSRLLHFLEFPSALIPKPSLQLFSIHLAQWGYSLWRNLWASALSSWVSKVSKTHHKGTFAYQWGLKQPFTWWTEQGERNQEPRCPQKWEVWQEVVRGGGGQGWRKDWEEKAVNNRVASEEDLLQWWTGESNMEDSDMDDSCDFMKHMKEWHAFRRFETSPLALW